MVQIKSALNSERLDLVEHDLREVGFHIIENVISAEEANEAREAIWEMVEEDVNNGRDHSYGNGKIRRVWAIVGKSPIFRKANSTPNRGGSVEADARRGCDCLYFHSEHRGTWCTCRWLAY